MTRSPSPDPDKPQTHARVRVRPYDATSTVEFLLRPCLRTLPGRPEWEVYAPNGDLTYRWIGTVGRYFGNLSWNGVKHKPGTRVDGKRRTLWSAKGTHADARTINGIESRAEAIRSWLL